MERIQKHINPAWTGNGVQHVLPAGGIDPVDFREQQALTRRILSHVMRLSWALGGMAVGVLFTMFALRVIPPGSGTLHGESMTLPDTFIGSTPMSKELLLATWENQQRLESLIRDVHTLSQAVAVLQDEVPDEQNSDVAAGALIPAHSTVTTPDNSQATATIATLQELPAPASGSAGKPRTTGHAASARTETAQTGSDISIAPQDEWVVNLASLPSKDAAQSLMAKVEAQGIPASLHEISVQGKTYWRVQAIGFESFTQAKTSARSIEEKLGTQGAWVMARANQQ